MRDPTVKFALKLKDLLALQALADERNQSMARLLRTWCVMPPDKGERQELPTMTNNETAERLHTIHTLQSELTSSPYSHDILELALATATSHQLFQQAGCPPVWLLIVGVPSSDKTNTISIGRITAPEPPCGARTARLKI